MPAAGLFDRQGRIGLEVPGWATVFVGGGLAAGAPAALELVACLAAVGAGGATVVVPQGRWFQAYVDAIVGEPPAGSSAREPSLLDSRPHFGAVVCDPAYYLAHRAEVGRGRAFYLAGPRPRGAALLEPPAGLAGGEGAVAACLLTGAVGQSRLPHLMLRDAEATHWVGARPFERANWLGGQASSILGQAVPLMAANWACKPSRYRPESFMYVQDFMDGVTARCFNERGLRPRWAKPAG